MLKTAISAFWYRPLPLYLKPLSVFSGLYRLIILIRRWFYACRKQQRFDVPIIVVGNLSVGGSGKTPLVAFLAQQLKAHGFKPGIVSRGYGARAAVYPCVVTGQSLASEVGDEPLMLHLKTTCPVVVDPERPRAVEKLLADFSCDVVISDDGLQHLDLSRDIEIIVVDGKYRFGNGYCLPLGPLREPLSALKKADFFVVNGQPHCSNEIPMQLTFKDFVAVSDFESQLTFNEVSGKKLHVIAGIAKPQRFFEMLKAQGLLFTAHAFPDHYSYQKNDFNFLESDALLLMTEKDAVKCREFSDSRFYYLPVNAVLPDIFLPNIIRVILK